MIVKNIRGGIHYCEHLAVWIYYNIYTRASFEKKHSITKEPYNIMINAKERTQWNKKYDFKNISGSRGCANSLQCLAEIGHMFVLVEG